MRAGIIGGGRSAWTFATLFARRGWELAGIVLRDDSASILPSAARVPRCTLAELKERCDLILVAVPDDALPELARQLGSTRATLFHSSGALSSEVFASPSRFSLHPLRSLPPAGNDVELDGTLFVFEGTDDCRPLAQELVDAARGEIDRIDAASKPLYHAAAVFASNYVAALCELSATLMARAGVAAATRLPIAALAHSAVENWRRGEGDSRYTGPLARGDREAVAAHLSALGDDPARRRLYAELAAILLDSLDQTPQREEIKAVLASVSRSDVP